MRGVGGIVGGSVVIAVGLLVWSWAVASSLSSSSSSSDTNTHTNTNTNTNTIVAHEREREREHEGQRPSHPSTPEREWVQRENQIVGALNDAVDLNDVNEMRRLIEIYREHDPSDVHKLQAGYTRIADCLQEPGEEAIARARHYYDTERASTVRRYVRRACFER